MIMKPKIVQIHLLLVRSLGNSEMKNAGLIAGARAQMLEDNDENVYFPLISQVPLGLGVTKSIKFVGVHSSASLLQVNLLDATFKKDDSEDNFSNASISAPTRDAKASEWASVGPIFNSADRTRNIEAFKAFEDGSGPKEGANMDARIERRVSRRKMYRASRIETPLSKGDLEEVGVLNLDKDKVKEQHDNRDECVDEEGLPGGHIRALSEGGQKSPDILIQRKQRRAWKNTSSVKSLLAEVGTILLPKKRKNLEQQDAGLAMSSFDMLAGEFLKASVVLETAEAHGGGSRIYEMNGETFMSRAPSGDAADEPSEVPEAEMVVADIMPGNMLPIPSDNASLAAAH